MLVGPCIELFGEILQLLGVKVLALDPGGLVRDGTASAATGGGRRIADMIGDGCGNSGAAATAAVGYYGW